MERVRNLTPATGPATLLRRVPVFLAAVRFQESAFALPFAYTGMLLAAGGWPEWEVIAWITVAMVSARTLGMSANRLIDRHIDAQNPRTSGRHMPMGSIRVAEMAVLSVSAGAVLVLAAAQLNPLALALAPVAAAYLVVYPYTKRFTWTANLLLGWALAIAPSAAWIGVRGSLSWEPVLLSAAVAFWAGSFDILYHTQDRDFYVADRLHSVAQRFGILAAFRWAQVMDVVAVACLIALGTWMGLAFPYFAGCALASGLLIYKYRLVSPSDLTRMGAAFFRINAYVSTTILASTAAALIVNT